MRSVALSPWRGDSLLAQQRVRDVPVEGTLDLSVDPAPGSLFLNPFGDAALRQKMAVAISNQRLIFLDASMSTGGEWASLRTFTLDYLVGVRSLPGQGSERSRFGRRGVGQQAEIVFADDVVFVLRSSARQAKSARAFVDALGTTSVHDRELPI